MQRRKFSREFKIEAVRLVGERGVSVAQASRDLDVHENVVGKMGGGIWRGSEAGVSRTRSDEARDRPAPAWGRKLRAERDILKTAAAYFVREST
jgi:transposase